MKTWNFIDKSQWPERGPWDAEPDKAQWTDEATGFPCLALRNHGSWCGYVGVTRDHPMFGQDYDHFDIEVHGGLTFSGFCQEGKGERRICHTPEPGQPKLVYWLGFDCAHAWDRRPITSQQEMEINLQIKKEFPLSGFDEVYRDLDYVRSECRSLAAQLQAMVRP
jgi:hypothetical protein